MNAPTFFCLVVACCFAYTHLLLVWAGAVVGRILRRVEGSALIHFLGQLTWLNRGKVPNITYGNMPEKKVGHIIQLLMQS